MANRIQLRRDTTANWNSVDPVLADGEPGYDIVTNEIRIGDGSTAWTGLSGNTISGGGGASTGNVTFSDINVIGTSSLRLQPNVALDESYIDIYLTSGPDIHIDTYSANLILGQDGSANVRLSTDGNVQIRAEDGGSTSTWTFDPDGNLRLPAGGTITEANVGVADALILTPANVSYSDQQLRIYSTGQPADANHLHLTTGNLHTSELYLGDDNYFVKLNNNGNIQIRAATQSLSATASWMFSTDGNLAFPNNSAFDGQTLTDHATGTNYTLKIANGGGAGSVFGIGTGNATYGIANDALNHAQDGYVPYSVTAQRISLIVPGGGSLVFDNTGNLTVPGNLISFTSSPAPFISGFGSADFSGNVTVGNLILPAGGQIQSESGTGNVTIEVNDGNNARTWAFTTAGNIHIPSVQYTDFVNIDATVSNVQTIGQNAYIEFGTFSGEILVNDLTDGYMYKILVGSGKCAVIGSTNSSWTTAAPGVSVTIASYIKIEFTGGKYRFTNLAPSRDYNFYTIKTRNHS